MTFVTDEMLREAASAFNTALMESLPERSACPNEVSESFEKRMEKVIRRANHYPMRMVLRRVACILVAFLLSASMFLTFNTEARAAVIHWVEENFHEFYHFFFVGEQEPQDTEATEGTVGTVPSEGTGATDGVTEPEGTTVPEEPAVYSLGWLPEGYVLMDSFVYDGINTSVYFSNAGHVFQFLYVSGPDGADLFAGVGEYERKYISADGFSAELLLAKDSANTSAILWQSEDGNIVFCISGFFAENEFVKMAENLVRE